MRRLRHLLTLVKFQAKRVAACRRGATAAEVALTLPLLTTMILAIFEYGSVVYSYSLMQLGANRVARTVAVNQMTEAQAQSAVTQYLPGWVGNRATVTVTQTAPGDPNTNFINVRVTASATAATPMALLTRAVPWQLTANVSMKQELPYVE